MSESLSQYLPSYDLSVVEDYIRESDRPGRQDALDALARVERALLTPSEQSFDFVESFWFLVALAEEALAADERLVTRGEQR